MAQRNKKPQKTQPESGLYVALHMLMLLSLICTAAGLAVLPDTIPMHYNAAGEMDRMGSKLEMLVFPAIIIGVGVFFLLLAGAMRKKGDYKNERALLWCGLPVLAAENIMTVYFTIKAYNFDAAEKLGGGLPDMLRFSCIILGTLICSFAFVFPKTHMNGMIGLRTTWSMKNEVVWERCQRFAGTHFAVCGAAIIVVTFFLGGIGCLSVCLGVLCLETAIAIYASYRIWRESESANGRSC